MAAEKKHEIETTFINLWVEAGFELVVNTTIAATMRRLKIDLVDVNQVLKTGTVIESDMIENRGLWMVRGSTIDELGLEITLTVISSEYEVELLRIVKVRRR